MNNFPRLAVAFGFVTFFGLWGILLFVMSWFSDPGIITYHDDTSSEKAQLEYASYDSDEKPFTAVCPIYKNEMYYKLRACQTCNIQRPPKASHCNTCGYCIRGWDHHCHAINNCVGRRNFRSFAMFLMVSTSWSLLNIIVSMTSAIYLYPDQWYYIVACAVCYLVNALIQQGPFRYLTKAIAVAILFTGGSILAFWWLNIETDSDTPTTDKLGYIFCILWVNTGFVYICVIKNMLYDYLYLITRHMTKKELSERNKGI